MGGHGIVLVHDRDDTEFELAQQRPAGVRVVLRADQIVCGEQHLAHPDSAGGECLRVGVDEETLPDGGRGLLRGEVRGAAWKSERLQS